MADRLTDDEVEKRFRYAEVVSGGAHVLREEMERARRVEQKQAETIKALADALEEAKALIDQYAHSEPVSTGGMMATRDHVDAALRKAGVLP